MASLHTPISPHSLLSLSKPRKPTSELSLKFSQKPIFARSKQKTTKKWVVNLVVQEELDVIPVQSGDQQEGVVVSREDGGNSKSMVSQVSVFDGSEGQLSFEGFSSASGVEDYGSRESDEEMLRLIDRTINATIVLVAGAFAITKLLTIDRDYWHGWTIYEILRYAPQHIWIAYEEALKTNPVLAKMAISGVVYSLGDWIAQCVEGKPLFEFDRTRMFRSGLVGFTLHGSLSHYYYQFCEELFPFREWWVVPAKVVFDQTAWSAVWNSIYFVVLGFLRLESPINILSELKATFWPMLTAGWKLWPFAHLITYGVIPVEQRLLWVDCVELIWVTILSTYSNEKSEARISEVPAEANSSSPFINPPEE
ncbi:Mpv17_PMP22 domain-containing protein [Cephalotus follicularis]|uniref:Mpv17_PMP22 domain-containing protein n=1 Tax=Cephalotus follicularis TaxID=3775 RepID=A0A1Q3DFI5_CEPFO|nr:Mpv17_PMP22 domain-containing protein [Cephalotus follicularis]